MAMKQLSAELKINAQDRTGAVFAAVARNLRGLGDTASQVSRRMDSVASRMSAFSRQAQLRQSIAARMSSGWGATVATGAVGAKVSAINQRMAAARAGLSDFAAAAAPGSAGMMFGAGVGTVGGLAFGGAAYYAAKKAISFDKAMADVKKKVTLDEGKSWADVEDMINRTSRAVGISREEMAALAAQAGQSGIAYKDLANFMMLAAKASAAWDIGAKEASQTMAEIKAQTGWTNKQLEEYANKVNYLGDISAAAEKDISSMWAKTSAGAKEAGVSYDDAMVALTAMKSVGMQEDVSSRAFGQLSSRLRTATSQKGAPAALKLLGLSAKDVEAGMKNDAFGTITNVLDRLGKSKDSVKVAVGLGGKEWFDEFLRIKAALPEMKRLKAALASGGAEGSLGKSLAVDLETTSKHLERFSTLTSEVGDRLARWALPSINASLENTMKLFDDIQAKGWWQVFTDNSKNQLTTSPISSEIPESAAMAKIPTLPSASQLWNRFWENSEGQRLRASIGGDYPESVAMTRQPLDLSGTRSIPSGALPSGLDAFGLGGPNWAKLAARMTPGGTIKAEAELKGSAAVSNRLDIGLAPGFALVRSDSAVRADGAMRADTGVTMPREE